ncbi:helix-turn-helix transcriptional regulator, partial [Paenibacillus sp. EKM208P]
NPITMDFLADLCHLSTTHFRRKFHEIMGTSPLDFLNSTRIEEACKQLKSTEDSILSISEQVGFHSISSFNRCFSRLMGKPP